MTSPLVNVAGQPSFFSIKPSMHAANELSTLYPQCQSPDSEYNPGDYPTFRPPVHCIFHRLSTLSGGTCYDAMGADPRLVFSGAPSTDINTGVSNFLGWIKRIVITNGRRSVRAYFSDNCECMIKNEEVTLPNGTTYKLTTTWVKEPRENIEVPEEQ